MTLRPRPSFQNLGRDQLSQQLLQQPSQQPSQQSSQQLQQPSQQESWSSDKSWRSIFDAALVKAQQAVQLDEIGQTAVASNLYAQAASDLGRVIPLCGSEKKKQSMLAIVSC
jgi:hypothetical protein